MYPGGEIYIEVPAALDLKQLLTKLEKRIAELKGEVEKAERKLSNEGFLKKASREVVEKVRKEKEEASAQLSRLERLVSEIGGSL